jgi:hypothetical protein
VRQFFGKMKTPVEPDAALDAAAMDETRRDPGRFDAAKIFPGSDWEFTKWNRVDAVGFLACLGISLSIVGLFWLVLKGLG